MRKGAALYVMLDSEQSKFCQKFSPVDDSGHNPLYPTISMRKYIFQLDKEPLSDILFSDH